MSASEPEQTKLAHGERRMAITGHACDIMSASEPEQAKLTHGVRRMAGGN